MAGGRVLSHAAFGGVWPRCRGKEAQIFARDIDIEESPIAVFGHGTWIVALVEIDPVVGPDVQERNRPELPARWTKALKQYRAGPAVKLANLL